MSKPWQWYPRSWNDVADKPPVNPFIGCSNVNCTERDVCWAKKAFTFHRHLYPADASFDKPFDMWERWDKLPWPRRHSDGSWPHKRQSIGWMSDIGDLQRDDETIRKHLREMQRFHRCSWLIQTRHVRRLIDLGRYDAAWDMPDNIEIGTTFSSANDIDNVRALGDLPEGVVRFIAFEPFPGTLTLSDDLVKNGIRISKPNWAYIGPQTGSKRKGCGVVRGWYERLAEFLESMNCKVIFKRSCGEELWRRNEGVTLP